MNWFVNFVLIKLMTNKQKDRKAAPHEREKVEMDHKYPDIRKLDVCALCHDSMC